MALKDFLGNIGIGRGGKPGGRMGGPNAAGPGGTCICTNENCLHEIPHNAGTPCNEIKCPKCGSTMTRKE